MFQQNLAGSGHIISMTSGHPFQQGILQARKGQQGFFLERAARFIAEKDRGYPDHTKLE
jgi:hypothetical protein